MPYIYYQELSDVLKQLQRGGIEVIVLKGAYLAKTVYQSEALRVIGDMDLLVKPADLSKAEKEMQNLKEKNQRILLIGEWMESKS